MKQVSAWLIAAALCLSANRTSAQTSGVVQTSNTTEKQPYKVALPNLAFGNNQYVTFVLNAWKSYDNNMVDEMAYLLADTVKVGLSDGRLIQGKEAFLKIVREHRGSFASVASQVTACTTLKSPNEPEKEFTLIWGEELDTKKDGTKQRFSLHEVWIFNTAGKVAELYMYAVPIPVH